MTKTKWMILAGAIVLLAVGIFSFKSFAGLTKNTGLKSVDELKVLRNEIKSEAAPVVVTPNVIIQSKQDLIGFWKGYIQEVDTIQKADEEYYMGYYAFSLSVDSIIGDQAFGHTLAKGKVIPLQGSFQFISNKYIFALEQKGNGKFDGTYRFSIANSDSVITGVWEPFDTAIEQDLEYDLVKRIHQYNPNDMLDADTRYRDTSKKKEVLWGVDEETGEEYYDEAYLANTEKSFEFNASTQILKEEDVQNLTKGDLIIIRNSIYARHGYAFKDLNLLNFFGDQSWYLPVFTDISAELTDLELQNIELLLRYEEHAEEYYDVFGR